MLACLRMSTLLLAAVFTSSPDPERVWSDAKEWETCPEVLLLGTGGSEMEAAAVRARWNREWLFFEFVCRDKSLVSSGRQDGEDHYKSGDVVEVFVARRERADYLEVHATPDGRKTTYAFRDYRRLAPAPEGIEVRAGETEGGWRAVFSLPWVALGGGPGDGTWEFLAGRYDYDIPGGEPRLSSFPGQGDRPDFHDRSQFAKLEFRT